ncbi:hypothetical protein RvY_16719 [Ramazzottius varieornatus]|uniref:Uncharacterized protein n=1 Tax=Ramazzottius varieornatus TaxID=947166 RepID=A0A1D1W6U2_RAMVA|nr:hypothetical protein RvY_16719 [Ramazzottius varieornatus]
MADRSRRIRDNSSSTRVLSQGGTSERITIKLRMNSAAAYFRENLVRTIASENGRGSLCAADVNMI